MSVIHIDAHRALNQAMRFTVASHCGSLRYPSYSYRPGVVTRYQGYSVTMASEHATYATSRQRPGRRHHLARAVFIAWRRGRIAGAVVICWCGTKLVTPELHHDIPDGCYPCASCEFRTSSVIHVTHVRVTVEAGRI